MGISTVDKVSDLMFLFHLKCYREFQANGNRTQNDKETRQSVATFLFEHQKHTFIFIKGDTVNVKKTKEMVKDQKDFISPYDKYR